MLHSTDEIPRRRKEQANSRMKLMVSLAAQSVLQPLCLRRLATAYATVRLM